MKIALTTLWLLVPLAFAAWHFGPGQDQLKLDDAQSLIAKADNALKEEDYASAIKNWEEAMSKLPKEEVTLGRRLELEIAKAKMLNSKLPEARDELVELMLVLDTDPDADPGLRDETRAALANARYYMTYLMKLEGLPDAMWEPEIEAARQEYKLLAENASDRSLAKTSADDLEAVIRLARMDPAELYGLPIPNQ
ncbi:hypothetical protein [Roseibacillus persicicus]|uniref:Uncharacterized protein n=1 Tax=Roseibacillus persicicus TaxID=454148 RepID=A0A918TJR1_9BACT|nr:hypothetical protein [Roseibacillus persicicus]MDQ8189940.1 hypothetical protein [Roseibacillus persicicus]GHC51334.1 hypothetical protein GCM10007100_16920 [Roseibacillus persicicus]